MSSTGSAMQSWAEVAKNDSLKEERSHNYQPVNRSLSTEFRSAPNSNKRFRATQLPALAAHNRGVRSSWSAQLTFALCCQKRVTNEMLQFAHRLAVKGNRQTHFQQNLDDLLALFQLFRSTKLSGIVKCVATWKKQQTKWTQIVNETTTILPNRSGVDGRAPASSSFSRISFCAQTEIIFNSDLHSRMMNSCIYQSPNGLMSVSRCPSRSLQRGYQ